MLYLFVYKYTKKMSEIKKFSDRAWEISRKNYFNFKIVRGEFDWFFGDTGVDILETAKKEFSCDEIFYKFLNGENLKKIIPEKINPIQYQKALNEFIRFGTFYYFPKEIIYKWFGFIVRKYVLIFNNSFSNFYFLRSPLDYGQNAVLNKVKETEKKNIRLRNHFIYEVDYTVDEFMEKYCLKDEHDVIEKLKDFNEEIKKPINHYFALYTILLCSEKSQFYSNEPYKIVNSMYKPRIDNDIIRLSIPFFYFLYKIGFLEWSFSMRTEDAGFSYIFPTLRELHNDMTIEEIFVWINRALDIAHYRGDLCGEFIIGGYQSFSKISEGKLIEL